MTEGESSTTKKTQTNKAELGRRVGEQAVQLLALFYKYNKPIKAELLVSFSIYIHYSQQLYIKTDLTLLVVFLVNKITDK